MPLLKPPQIKDIRVKYPTNLAEAKSLIEETFNFNEWKKNEQKHYFESLKITAETTKDLSPGEAKTVINDLAKARMILFEL